MPETRPDGGVRAEDRPLSPDLDLGAGMRSFRRRVPWATLSIISAGGVVGALARHGLTQAFPHQLGAFVWITFAINVAGCALIGVLMVLISEVWRAHPMVRPFLGVGVLGGFTTFSSYIVDAQQALESGAAHIAVAYLAATPVAALIAVFAGAHSTRLLTRPYRERKDHP